MKTDTTKKLIGEPAAKLAKAIKHANAFAEEEIGTVIADLVIGILKKAGVKVK